MNLSKLDSMFTETSFGENASEVGAVSSPDDLDFGIGKLCVSPVRYESTSERADTSSMLMLRSDVSPADALLSPFDSISFDGNDIGTRTIKCDDISSVCEASLQGQRLNEEQVCSTHDSPDSVRIHGLSRHEDAEAEVVDEIERTQKLNDHLIVYTSSRRNCSSNISSEPNHNNNASRKPPKSCRVIIQKDSMSNLKSSQISRKKRSLLSKRAKSSVWGLPTIEENNVPNSNEKIVGRVGGGQGKSHAIKDQTGQKAVCKSSTPTGRISLKIKIGNQSFGVKSISGLSNETDSKFRKEFPGKMLSTENISEKARTSDASAFGAHLDVTCHVENKSLGTLSDQQISSHEEGDNLRPSIENRCSDPGTSPDSEVINSVPDASIGERNLQVLQDSPTMALETSNGECLANSISPKMKSRKGKKMSSGKAKHKVRGANPRMTNSDNPCTTSEEVCCGFGVNPSPELSGAAGSLKSQDYQSLNVCSNGQKSLECSEANGGCKSRNGILNLPCKKGKASKKKGDRNNFQVKHQIDAKDDTSGVLSRVESHVEAGNQSLLDLGEMGDPSIRSTGTVSVSSSGRLTGLSTTQRNAWVLCDECQKWRRIPATLADEIEQTNSRWTCKDNTDKDFADCSISQEKSNSEINEELEISDEDGDTMPKYNKNKPTAANQARWSLIKSNLFLHRSRKTQTIDEVMVCHCKPPSDGRMGCGSKCLNRMLNIECVRGTCPCGELCSNQQFQKQTYADLKWLRCGKKGFGLQALQDISEGQFIIEYVGEVLDVHAHEARQKEYALLGHKHFYFMTLNGSEVIDACAKGNLGRFINHSCDPNCRTEKWMVNGEVCVGLFAIRDVKKGEEVTFDYNYVRVLGAAAKKCVCGSPNCRGYIGGDPTNSEVIVQEDSDDEFAEPVMICEDRAMTRVWNEIMSQSVLEKEDRSIDELEEERDRMKNANAVDQFQSITSGTSNRKLGVNSASHGRSKTSIATRVVDMAVRDKYEPESSVGNKFASDAAVTPIDTTQESLRSSGSATLKAESESILSGTCSPVKLMDASFRLEEPMKSTMSNDNGLKMSITTLPGKLQPDAVESKKKLKFNTMRRKEEFSKSGPLAKTRDSSPSIKKGKLKPNAVNGKGTLDGDKLNAARQKSKKSPGLSLNSNVEAVEGKLNELLDTEGGISKRKDASRGYLKLLFLTAAFGTNGHGEAIQSNRDLSMILDALLKTKSRTVLVDIINKNGLQMLHNIMKRYRKEFNKTPILRKLLKVLEYLAMREILTLEHITGGPPRPGVESFKDSMLTLTEHSDKQVHQIARNFRARWIPRSLRKNCFIEMDDGKKEFRQNSTYGKPSSSADQWSVRGGKYADSSDRGNKHTDSSDRVGKHADSLECCDKEPMVVPSFETSTVDHSSASGCSNGRRKRKSRWDIPAEECMHPMIRTSFSGDGKQNVDDDVPPGFSSPCNGPIIPASNQERETSVKHPSNIVSADSQERFIARMPLSYGIPSSLVQQFGVLEAEAAEVWTVAPGLPFHPFPPLPPSAIEKGEHLTAAANSVSKPLEKTGEEVRYSGKKRSSPCSSDQLDTANEHQDCPGEEGSYNLGRKYFRQQKLNPSKLVRNGWEHPGSTRNGVPGVGLRHGTNQFGDS